MSTRVNKQVERFYPLAPMQEGILFHTLYDPQSGVYFEQLTCLLEGDLDEAALRRAWEQVVARHTIFRTAFVWEGLKAPVQVVYRQVTPPWTRFHPTPKRTGARSPWRGAREPWRRGGPWGRPG